MVFSFSLAIKKVVDFEGSLCTITKVFCQKYKSAPKHPFISVIKFDKTLINF